MSVPPPPLESDASPLGRTRPDWKPLDAAEGLESAEVLGAAEGLGAAGRQPSQEAATGTVSGAVSSTASSAVSSTAGTASQPDLAHPYYAASRWQVLLALLALLGIALLSIIGWWRIAVALTVLTLLAAMALRLVARHSWMRARSTVFDVTLLGAMAVALTVLLIFLAD